MNPTTLYLLSYVPHIVSVVCAGALLATLLHDQKRIAIAARKKALAEATAVLQRPADVAGAAVEYNKSNGYPYVESASRAYHYQRAASLVASIPEDRV